MKSMELDDEDKVDAPMPIKTKVPDFPWGLKISLSEKELAKLGLDESEAEVGGTCMIHGKARITSVSHSEDAANEYSEGGKRHRIELQIEELSIDCDEDKET